MSLTRWVAVLAPAVAAILLPVPALASNALQSSAPSATVVSHQSQTVTIPRVTCDQLIRVHHLPAGTPCTVKVTTDVTSTPSKAGVTPQFNTTQRKTWAVLGGYAGGDVTAHMSIANGVVTQTSNPTCGTYALPGFSVHVTWCGGTGSGSYTLTSGANFDVNEPGVSLTGMGLREWINAAQQIGSYCWQGPWIIC